mmetsp:Transcript_11615/g.25103  ORF Transcript_11615/g.25103 Transcript_11615/m.25103 type:complete len:204 (+) Transcript_11615:73-684(+)
MCLLLSWALPVAAPPEWLLQIFWPSMPGTKARPHHLLRRPRRRSKTEMGWGAQMLATMAPRQRRSSSSPWRSSASARDACSATSATPRHPRPRSRWPSGHRASQLARMVVPAFALAAACRSPSRLERQSNKTRCSRHHRKTPSFAGTPRSAVRRCPPSGYPCHRGRSLSLGWWPGRRRRWSPAGPHAASCSGCGRHRRQYPPP